MGLSVSPDIYQEKMSNIDDILVITKGTFQEHLKVLQEVLHRLALHQLEIHADKSKFCGFETEFIGFTLCSEGIRPQERRWRRYRRVKCRKTLSKSDQF
jgi:hypothetical protein